MSKLERRLSISNGHRDNQTDRLRDSNIHLDKFGLVDTDAKNPVKQSSSMWKTAYKAKLPNTYRLGPLHKFSAHLVRKTAEDLMGSFGDMAYNHDACGEVAIKVADSILAFIKTQAFDRYRYVVRVVVMEKQGQSVMFSSRMLSDDQNDNFLTLKHENKHLFAVGMVFAIYLD